VRVWCRSYGAEVLDSQVELELAHKVNYNDQCARQNKNLKFTLPCCISQCQKAELCIGIQTMKHMTLYWCDFRTDAKGFWQQKHFLYVKTRCMYNLLYRLWSRMTLLPCVWCSHCSNVRNSLPRYFPAIGIKHTTKGVLGIIRTIACRILIISFWSVKALSDQCLA
jgi:hypothetical protein